VQSYLEGIQVEPEVPMYQMEPYYQSSPSVPTNAEGSVKSSPQQQGLEAKQLALIKALEQFRDKLNQFSSGQKKDVKPAGKKVEKVEKKKEQQVKGKSSEKVEKKKEHPASKKIEKAEKKNQPEFTVPPRKSTASAVYTGLNVKLDPFGYKPQLPEKFKLQLECQDVDKNWIGVLSKLAAKQNVEIAEKSNGSRVILVKFGSDGVKLSGAPLSTPVQGRITVWKTLGALIGLFSYTDAALSASTHKWLQFAEDFIEGRVSGFDAIRKACFRLAQHDFLAAHDIATLSDFIVCAMIKDAGYLPNNVELWVKRLESA